MSIGPKYISTPKETADSMLERKSIDKAIEYASKAIGNSISRNQLRYWEKVRSLLEEKRDA